MTKASPVPGTPAAQSCVSSSRYDAVATSYGTVRPGYPVEVFRAIEAYAGFGTRPRVIEVGCGTGQATRQMAALGWSVEAIEPGSQLLATAEAATNTGAVQFQHARFEDATIESGAFDLVVAATSWHWVDSDIGYRKAHDALVVGGTIALFWNAHVPDTSHPHWVTIRQVYLDVAPELADLAPLTPDRPDYDPIAELRRSHYFEAIERQEFPFEVSYSTDTFLTLLDTYASHDVIEAARRYRLYERLGAAIEDDLGGSVTQALSSGPGARTAPRQLTRNHHLITRARQCSPQPERRDEDERHFRRTQDHR